MKEFDLKKRWIPGLTQARLVKEFDLKNEGDTWLDTGSTRERVRFKKGLIEASVKAERRCRS